MKKIMLFLSASFMFMCLFVSTSIAGDWKNIWGPVGQVVMGYTSPGLGVRIYATDLSSGDLYRYDGEPFKWTKIGGPGKMFAVGAGDLYGLSPDGSGVYRYDGTPMKWTKIGGPAANIYSKGIELYATNPHTGDIYRYDGQPFKWTKIGGPGKAFAAGGTAGKTGVLYLYGLSPDGSGIYRYDSTPMKWTKIGGSATNIYAGGSEVYFTDPQLGNIYQWDSSQTPFKWTKIGGPGKMFTVDEPLGNIYGISPDGSGVYRYDETPMKWSKIGGSADKIYSSAGVLCATNPDNYKLWCYGLY